MPPAQTASTGVRKPQPGFLQLDGIRRAFGNQQPDAVPVLNVNHGGHAAGIVKNLGFVVRVRTVDVVRQLEMELVDRIPPIGIGII